MDMPCVCNNCGKTFDLLDGNPSSDLEDNTIYCQYCVKEPWGELLKLKKKYHTDKTQEQERG